ncbi:MAG: hypothetical protein SNH13_00575 [Rikenellaceae bacterium]
MKKFFAALIMAFLCVSCTHRIVDFTIISTKNVPIDGVSTLKSGEIKVKGQDAKYMFLTIPLGTPDLKEAVDDAIEKAPGAVALSNGVVYTSWWYAILTGCTKYVVVGTPLYINTPAAE